MPVKIYKIIIRSAIVGLIVGATLCLSLYFYSTNRPRKNLILISIDTLRADHMGVYGYDKNTTPNIDAFSKSSIVYNNFYTIFPETFHSFFTLFTGSQDVITKADSVNAKNPFFENFIRNKRYTIAEVLNKRGYNTAAFVTNPVLGSIFPFFSRGFQEYNYINESAGMDDKEYLSYKYDYQNGNKIVSESKKWLNNNKDTNFFLWLHFTNPHMPYNPPEEYLCKIDSNCHSDQYKELIKSISSDQVVLNSCTEEENSEEKIRLLQNLYDAEILSVDDQIGQILRYLQTTKLMSNTTIIIYADHGEGFDHNIFGHQNSLYESGVHIPLIIKLPGEKPKRINDIVDNSMIFAFIFDLLHLKYDKKTIDPSGSLSVSTFRRDDFSNPFIFLSTPAEESNKKSVMNKRYKYIISYSQSCRLNNEREELYDIQKDPQEAINLIHKEGKIKQEMSYTLNKYINKNNINTAVPQETKNEIKERLKKLGY